MNDPRTLAEHVSKGLSAPHETPSSTWFDDDEGTRQFQRTMARPEHT